MTGDVNFVKQDRQIINKWNAYYVAYYSSYNVIDDV